MALVVFSGVPAHVWWALGVAVVIGVLTLLLAYRVFKEDTLRRDLARDIGIAFIVAAVVSAIYEYSTRSIDKRHVLLDSINEAMSAFVPESAWSAVKDQVIRRNAARRNVDITLRVSRQAPAVNGKPAPALAPGQAVLWVSYSYDLYGLADDASTISISHELDYFMHNAQLDLPRFERVLITGPDSNDRREYRGNDPEIYKGKGQLELTGKHAVRLPPPKSGKPVRILTERYEIVNTPGYYYLVMRELTAKDEKVNSPTVTVNIQTLPPDLGAEVQTFYAPHNFVQVTGTNVWQFKETLLPGQGLTVVFKPISAPTLTQATAR